MKTIVWFVLVLSALSAAGNVVKVKAGGKATIKCGVQDYYNSLSWHHGADSIISTTKKTFPRKGQNDLGGRSQLLGDINLMIKNVKKEDGGEFTCKVDGKPQKHKLLVVSVWVSPSSTLNQGSQATVNCQVGGLDPGAVQWQPPNGKPIQRTPVNISSVDRSHSGIWVCEFFHAKEKYTENLTITVEVSAPTTSPPQTSKDISVANSTPSNAPGLQELEWWIWVAVGVGGLVVVFLMVLVIVLCKRIKRRKKRLLKIKNAGQQLNPRQYCQCDRPTAAAKPQQGRRREKPY